jgi:hypothetical protein
MPIDCRISTTLPERAEIMQLFSKLPIPEDLTITISPSLIRGLGWDLRATGPGRTMVCSVPASAGPAGLVVAVRNVLANGGVA